MNLRLYDAHNHLQDDRLAPHREAVLAAVQREASSEWWSTAPVKRIGRRCWHWPANHPQVIPSFGYHPWYVKERSPDWQQALLRHLEAVPSAVGEVGLDRWVKDYDLAQQQEVFVWQLRLAAERNLPLSIHCLQAWGPLLDILRAEPRPACGFLLHSYGGAAELVAPLTELGAYFSLPGYFAHERKTRQREAFLKVPPDRLLIETDAPDQILPRRARSVSPHGCGLRQAHQSPGKPGRGVSLRLGAAQRTARSPGPEGGGELQETLRSGYAGLSRCRAPNFTRVFLHRRPSSSVCSTTSINISTPCANSHCKWTRHLQLTTRPLSSAICHLPSTIFGCLPPAMSPSVIRVSHLRHPHP